MAILSKDDLISLIKTQVVVRREKESQHKLKIAEMEHQQVLELRALRDVMETIRLRERAREPKTQNSDGICRYGILL